jgi:hypothetical protein
MTSHLGLRLSSVGLLLLLSGGLAPVSAVAQDANADGLAGLAKTLHQKTDVPEASDFVKKSRAKAPQNGFIPVHSPRSQPKGKPMSGDQIRAREAELQQVLTRNAALADKKPALLKGQSAAGAKGGTKSGAKGATKTPPAPPCVLTCQIK